MRKLNRNVKELAQSIMINILILTQGDTWSTLTYLARPRGFDALNVELLLHIHSIWRLGFNHSFRSSSWGSYRSMDKIWTHPVSEAGTTHSYSLPQCGSVWCHRQAYRGQRSTQGEVTLPHTYARQSSIHGFHLHSSSSSHLVSLSSQEECTE